MRKLSEIKGEDALDILADIIEPASEFATDEKFVNLARKNDRIGAVQQAIKGHKKAVLRIMAILEGVDVKNYNPPLLRLPKMLLEMFNDPELVSLFTSEQTVTSSGSATVNTEEKEA